MWVTVWVVGLNFSQLYTIILAKENPGGLDSPGFCRTPLGTRTLDTLIKSLDETVVS